MASIRGMEPHRLGMEVVRPLGTVPSEGRRDKRVGRLRRSDLPQLPFGPFFLASALPVGRPERVVFRVGELVEGVA